MICAIFFADVHSQCGPQRLQGKRLLGYSSIAHAGYALIGILTATDVMQSYTVLINQRYDA